MIMQKIERNFLVLVILLIIVIIGVAIYMSFWERGIDRNSYVELISWSATLNEKSIEINKKEKLSIEDVVTTTSQDSLAIIEWWDWSITRLWPNTSVKIWELYVADNKDKINISFELIEWKTWSNVISFIPDNSYFRQLFWDYEAAVRGTIFNIDLEKDYIYVIENKIDLSKTTWENVTIEELKPFRISSFSFIPLEEFIKSVRDWIFDASNRLMDTERYLELQNHLIWKIQNFTDYSTIQVEQITDYNKNEVYQNLLSMYQEFNFLNPDSGELYDEKINIKEKLIEIAPPADKELLLESLTLDFNEILKFEDYVTLNRLVDIFKANATDVWLTLKDKISELTDKISNLTDKIPSSWKDAFMNNINDMKNVFNTSN